ncbi:MAG: hypothetical protein HKN07_05855 [Acidimicrobiia bacterium]|nr:SRPBCC family protein [Acidimicrobiia bacterium]NNF63768.1 hypothetical protein [Acidimicrobiia bacterium]
MAHYIATVETQKSAEEVFDYIADFRNLEEWDPGVSSASMSKGDAPGVGTVYSVRASGADLDYVTLAYTRPTETTLEAKSRFVRSYDTVTVEATESGSTVTYDAILELRSFAAVLNPILGLFFDRIGDRAVEGMERVLDGRRVR